MAGTADVISRMERLPGNHYPVLVPNMKGLEGVLELLAKQPSSSSTPPPTDEIAIFAAATEAFSKANTNCTIAESLERLGTVTRKALEHGLRVRGCVPRFLFTTKRTEPRYSRYVSVVISCPYEGSVDPQKVKAVTQALLDMGCYEVSLGDTVGTGTPSTVRAMLETVMGGSGSITADKLAVRVIYGQVLPILISSL